MEQLAETTHTHTKETNKHTSDKARTHQIAHAKVRIPKKGIKKGEGGGQGPQASCVNSLDVVPAERTTV